MRIAAFDPGIDASWARLESGCTHLIETGVIERCGIGRLQRPDGSEIAELIIDVDVVVIEEVGPMPRHCVASIFHFGLSFGAVLGAAAACNKQVHLVRPQVWKSHHRIKGSGLAGQSGKTEDKKISLRLARQYWPGTPDFRLTKDHGRAEAALIALWYARIQAGATVGGRKRSLKRTHGSTELAAA